MAKDRSFAAKVAKGTIESNKCQMCGELKNVIMVVGSDKKENKDSFRFKEKFVAVCKCNEKEVYA